MKMIRRIYKYICRKLGRYPKWHSVVINDENGKSTVYLDGKAYLFYGHILSCSYKRKLKKNPFCLFKPVDPKLNYNHPLSEGLSLCNMMDKSPK